MTVDLTPMIQAAVGFATLAIGVFGSWAIQRLAVKFNIQITAERRAMLDGALNKAAQAGAIAAENLASTRGWDHPDVRNQMLAEALNYLGSRFGDTLKSCGIDPNDAADRARMSDALSRVLPAAAAPIAASPITTNGPPAAPAA